MTGSQMEKFLSALEEAGISKYEFDTDLGTHLYNNENAILKADIADELAYNFRSTNTSGAMPNAFGDPIQIVEANFADIHEVRASGSYDQIKKFVEKTGAFTLTDEDINILLHIDTANRQLKPITGDYNNFHYLTERELEKLTPEERAAYEAAKEAYETAQKNYIGQHSAAQITL